MPELSPMNQWRLVASCMVGFPVLLALLCYYMYFVRKEENLGWFMGVVFGPIISFFGVMAVLMLHTPKSNRNDDGDDERSSGVSPCRVFLSTVCSLLSAALMIGCLYMMLRPDQSRSIGWVFGFIWGLLGATFIWGSIALGLYVKNKNPGSPPPPRYSSGFSGPILGTYSTISHRERSALPSPQHRYFRELPTTQQYMGQPLRVKRPNKTTRYPTRGNSNARDPGTELEQKLLSLEDRDEEGDERVASRSTRLADHQYVVQVVQPEDGRPAGRNGAPAAAAAVDCPKDVECAICLDVWTDPVALVPCGHIYCSLCVKPLEKCPQCRAAIQGQQLPASRQQREAGGVTVECPCCGWRGSKSEAEDHSKLFCPGLVV